MSFGKRNGGGRRTAQRDPAPSTAVFTTVTESCAAEMVDLSATGARLRSPQVPELEEELIVTVDTVRAFGRVAWVRGNQFGISFEDPLVPAEVVMLKGKVARPTGLSPEVDAALDDWNTGLAR